MNRPAETPKRMIQDHSSQVKFRRTAVALGGGGARGIAHLGVLQALNETGVRIEQIVGVSMGGLIGGIYSSEPDIHHAKAKIIKFLNSPLFSEKINLPSDAKCIENNGDAGGMFSWYRKLQKGLKAQRQFMRAISSPALASDVLLRRAIDCLLPDCDLRDLEVPLSLVALDLFSGERVVLEQGPLRLAVQASSAIAGIFEPVPWDDMLLCDIGSIESIPTLVAQSYDTDFVIGVNVGPSKTRIKQCKTVLDIMMRMEEISECMTRKTTIKLADIHIHPEVGDVEWFDFSEPNRLIDAGLDAGRRAIERFKYQATA